MKNNLIIVSLLLVVASFATNSTTYFRWDNNSPYVFLISSYFVSLVNFPGAIAPFSTVSFQLQNNETMLIDHLNVVEYDCYLGSIGDVYGISFGGEFPIPNYENLTKKIGTFTLFYFSQPDLDRVSLGMSSNISDQSLSNQLLLNVQLCSQSDIQDSSCIYGDGIVKLQVNTTIQAHIGMNQDNTDLLSPQDLLSQWKQLDPEGKGKFMEDLRDCVFENEALFNSSLVFDDFDKNYNSVGWSIGRAAGGAFMDEPLQSYDDALSYYTMAGYVETSCDEIVSQPSIALYCLPGANSDSNGGCKEDTLLNYTHVAVRMSDSTRQRWVSKFDKGPLISHDSLSSISRSDCPITQFFVGQPVLCFKKPFDATFRIENKSPFSLSIVNATISDGFWKNSKIPAAKILPFKGNDEYAVESGSKAQIWLWYRVSLGAANSSKTMGYLSLYSRAQENSNIFSLSPSISSPHIPLTLLHMSYSSEVGNHGWQNGNIEMEGGPIAVNISAELSNTTNSLLAAWFDVDPTHKWKTLDELSKCIYQDQNLFENAQVIDDFDDNYNAFGWTVGNTVAGNFDQPAQDEESAVGFYKSYNFTLANCSNEDEFIVALFCHIDPATKQCIPNYDPISGDYMYTHAALKLSNNLWSSKFWTGPLLTHPNLVSLTGNCSDASSLPVSSLGTVALCFKKITSDLIEFERQYPIHSNDSAPKIGLNFSSIITVSNIMLFDLMQPYEPYLYTSSYTAYDPENHWKGLKDVHGYFPSPPPHWISSWESKTFLMKDHSIWPRGTEGSVGFHVAVGSVENYMTLRQKLPQSEKDFYSLKSLEKDFNFRHRFEDNPVTLSFGCPLISPNYAAISHKQIYNPARACEPQGLDCSPLKNIVFIKLAFSNTKSEFTWMNIADFFTPWYLPPSAHPMTVYFSFVQVSVSLKDLLDNWIKTAVENKVLPNILNGVIAPIMSAFNATLDYQGIPSINCTLSKQNQKLCNAQVLDDADDYYNSASWSMGISGNYFLEGPLIDRNSAKKWYGYLDYELAPYCGEVGIIPEFEIALYCNRSVTGECIPYMSGNRQYLYTHVAIMKNLTWTSKLTAGPLIMHRNLMDLPGFGSPELCFRKKDQNHQNNELLINEINDVDKFDRIAFTKDEFALVESVTNKISQTLINEFKSLLARWHFLYSQIHLPNLINFNYEPLYEIEISLKEELLSIVGKYPETIYLIIGKMMSPDEGRYHYVIFKYITGASDCGEELAGPIACSICAKRWLNQISSPKHISI